MGLYSTVTTSLRCAKCAQKFSAEVQFKTGWEQDLPSFRENERAIDVPAGTYEGITGCYCAACMERWVRAEKIAHFSALAESVSEGALHVRRGTVVRDAHHVPIPDEQGDFKIELREESELLPAEITSAGEELDPRPGWPNFPARLSELDYVLFEGAIRLFPTRLPARSEWWERHRARVTERLRAAGWPLGDDQWIELAVVVSADQVLRVERSGSV
jgi:hypothetical protein